MSNLLEWMQESIKAIVALASISGASVTFLKLWKDYADRSVKFSASTEWAYPDYNDSYDLIVTIEYINKSDKNFIINELIIRHPPYVYFRNPIDGCLTRSNTITINQDLSTGTKKFRVALSGAPLVLSEILSMTAILSRKEFAKSTKVQVIQAHIKQVTNAQKIENARRVSVGMLSI